MGIDPATAGAGGGFAVGGEAGSGEARGKGKGKGKGKECGGKVPATRPEIARHAKLSFCLTPRP